MATALTQTTLSAAITANQNIIPVASATGITAPVNGIQQKLYIIGPGQARGELVQVTAVNSTQISVARLDEYKAAWPSGSLVLIAPPVTVGANFSGMVMGGFQAYDPPGASASNNSNLAAAVQVTPWVNIITGAQWIWSTLLSCWVPGWNNTYAPPAVTALVSSAAGPIVPSGPLFHVDGTAAVTGFTNASMIGFTMGSFTIIPDAAFTWTNANNIGLGGTAVAGKALTFIWDASAAKWYASYIA